MRLESKCVQLPRDGAVGQLTERSLTIVVFFPRSQQLPTVITSRTLSLPLLLKSGLGVCCCSSSARPDPTRAAQPFSPAEDGAGAFGKLLRRPGIQWSQPPAALGYSQPYAVAALPDHVEARCHAVGHSTAALMSGSLHTRTTHCSDNCTCLLSLHMLKSHCHQDA